MLMISRVYDYMYDSNHTLLMISQCSLTQAATINVNRFLLIKPPVFFLLIVKTRLEKRAHSFRFLFAILGTWPIGFSVPRQKFHIIISDSYRPTPLLLKWDRSTVLATQRNDGEIVRLGCVFIREFFMKSILLVLFLLFSPDFLLLFLCRCIVMACLGPLN